MLKMIKKWSKITESHENAPWTKYAYTTGDSDGDKTKLERSPKSHVIIMNIFVFGKNDALLRESRKEQHMRNKINSHSDRTQLAVFRTIVI